MRFLSWFKQNRAVLVTVIEYATAVAIAVTIFIYVTFPWQKLSDWIRVKMERAMAVEIHVDESHFRFPLRLEWDGVTVTRLDRSGPLRMTAQKVTVNWPIGAVLRRKVDLQFSSRLLGGEMHGRLSARRSESGIQYHFRGSARGLELGELAVLFQFSSEDLGGTVEISGIEHYWLNQDWMRGEGKLVFEATGVEHRALEIRFRRLSGTVTLKSGMSNLENFSAQGSALDLVGSGSLLLRPKIMNSLLNFNSRVTLRNPTGPLGMLSVLASPEGHLDLSF